MRNLKHEAMKHEALEEIVEGLQDYSGYYADLHHEVFNTDYYIIGVYQAKQALEEYDIFEAIGLVKQYEQDMFGEVFTDISNPEKVINMIYYICGEEVISTIIEASETLSDNWNNVADHKTNKKILDEIKNIIL